MVFLFLHELRYIFIYLKYFSMILFYIKISIYGFKNIKILFIYLRPPQERGNNIPHDLKMNMMASFMCVIISK